MSIHSSLDREFFEKYLASAFAVQESGLQIQSLSTLVELQRSIMAGAAPLDRVVHVVVEAARKVANATGIAIALLNANQLVYEAGSGSAAEYVGKRVAAVLTVSTRSDTQNEILRVENSEADRRIESAVCRQFGARSLLILPIYQEQKLAGVMEIFFSEPHTFDNREVLSYRVMAQFVEQAMLRDSQTELAKPETTEATSIALGRAQIAFHLDKQSASGKACPHPAQKACAGEGFRRDTMEEDLPDLCSPLISRRAIMKGLKEAAQQNRWRSLAAGLTILALVIPTWIMYSGRTASPAHRGPDLTEQQGARHFFKLPVENGPQLRILSVATKPTHASSSGFKRVKRGQNEVDYIADEVIIRHFAPNLARSTVSSEGKQRSIGEDVTVRYFAYNPEIGSKSRPATAPSPESTQPISK